MSKKGKYNYLNFKEIGLGMIIEFEELLQVYLKGILWEL